MKDKCLEGIANPLMDVFFIFKQFIDKTNEMFSGGSDSTIKMKRPLYVEMLTVDAIAVDVLLTSLFSFQLVVDERNS